MTAEAVPENSLKAMLEEMNRIAAANPYADAMASVIKMFGESFEAEKIRETWKYCDLETKELRRAENADALHQLGMEERFERLREHAELIFSDQNPDRATAFVVLFRELEGKMYREKYRHAMLAFTTDIEDTAEKLDIPKSSTERAVARRHHDKSSATKAVSDNANADKDIPRQKVLKAAQKLYLEKPYNKKTWNPTRAENQLLVDVRGIAKEFDYKHLGSGETEVFSALATLARWFTAAECGRNPACFERKGSNCNNCDCPYRKKVQPSL